MIYTEKPVGFVADFSAVGCFVESEGKILQLLRAGNAKIEPAKWGAPAGKIEKNETPGVAMVRELSEETGLLVLASQLRHISNFFVVYPSCKFIYHLYWMNFRFAPEIVLSNEHVGKVWIHPYMASSLKLMIDELECIKLAYALQ